jgi:hypothetical protein
MASVVTAAPMDGAPLLALHRPNKRFGATHALKLVTPCTSFRAAGLVASHGHKHATQEIILTEVIGA